MPAKKLFSLCVEPERGEEMVEWISVAENPSEIEVITGESVQEIARRRCRYCSTRTEHLEPCNQPRGMYLMVPQSGEPIKNWDRIVLDTLARYDLPIPMTGRLEPLFEVKIDQSVAYSVAAARKRDELTAVLNA